MSSPGWWRRAGPLLRDLLTFDAARLDMLLAARTLLALFLPLLGAELLGWRNLIPVGIGAFLVCIGDCVEDGDTDQFRRLLAGLVLGSLAFGSGVLCGGHLATAIAGMMVWGIVCGLMGLWGAAYGAMSMPVVWAYVELGLPAPEHDPSRALELAGLFACGGMLAIILTFAFARLFPLRHQRRLSAACYAALADYVSREPRPGHVSPETQVRAAIAQARHALNHARSAGQDTTLQRLSLLTETADHLFSLVSLLRETDPAAAARFQRGFLALSTAIRRGSHSAGTQAIPPQGSGPIGNISAALSCAQAQLSAPLPAADIPPQTDKAPVLPLLWENLTFRSVALRHAVRFASVMAVAVVIFWLLPRPFGFWVPLTVTVVLKPYAGMTLARALQRVAGTMGGILLAMALMPLMPTAGIQLAFVFAAFFLMMMVLPFNYSLAVFFLSAGIVPYEHVLMPGLTMDVAGFRLLATLAGAALALVGGHLLWPDFEYRALPALVARTRDAMALYARAVLSRDSAAIGPAHRGTGLEVTNLQTALQRAMTEMGGGGPALERMAQASASLQRLFISLNAVRLSGPPGVPPGFADAFAKALARPAHGAAERCRHALESGSPLEGLCADLQKLEQASLQAESTPPAAAQPVANEA